MSAPTLHLVSRVFRVGRRKGPAPTGVRIRGWNPFSAILSNRSGDGSGAPCRWLFTGNPRNRRTRPSHLVNGNDFLRNDGSPDLPHAQSSVSFEDSDHFD